MKLPELLKKTDTAIAKIHKASECIGFRIDRLQVVEIVPNRDKHRHIIVKCLCDCGNTCTKYFQNIKKAKSADCGCSIDAKKGDRIQAHKDALVRQRDAQARQRNELVGKRFSRLQITDVKTSKTVECLCDCGKTVITYIHNLKREHTQSCGCLRVYRHPEKNVGLRKLYYRYTFRSKKRHGEEFLISLEDFKKITSSNCVYCGVEPGVVMKSRSSHSEYLYNGLDRVDTSKGYSIENVVPCCIMCNRMKLDYTVEDFLSHVQRINHFSQKK